MSARRTLSSRLAQGALLAAALALAGCANDYTKPDDSGGTTPANTDRGVTYTTSLLPPAAGTCGRTYSGRATVRQQVFACAGYDFTGLYDRARASAQFQVQQVACPAECAPRHDWLDFREWNCVDGRPIVNATIAYAVVEARGLCPRPADARPAGLGAPVAGALGTHPSTELGRTSGSIGVIEEIGDDLAVACPKTDVAIFDYLEPVAACAPLNYQPFVQNAERLARLHHQSVPCATGCTRRGFRKLNTVWGCRTIEGASEVAVKVYYEIACRRP